MRLNGSEGAVVGAGAGAVKNSILGCGVGTDAVKKLLCGAVAGAVVVEKKN